MKISPALADLNYDRNQNWQPPFSLENAKQAVYAFTGEVFRGIDIESLPEEKISIVQDRLRILSGLYGLLKPLDLMQPYRLEMGTRIKVGKTENLYKFWGNTIANELKNGEYKIVMTYAKKARGFMVRYIIDNDVNTLDKLKGFNTEGYGFSEALSTETELIFTR